MPPDDIPTATEIDLGEYSDEDMRDLVKEVEIFNKFRARNLQRLSDRAFIRIVERYLESVEIIVAEMQSRGFSREEAIEAELDVERARELVDQGRADELRELFGLS